MIERCFKTKSVMKTNRNQFIILIQPIEWCFIKSYLCLSKKIIYNLSQTKNGLQKSVLWFFWFHIKRSSGFNSVDEGHLYMSKGTDKFYLYQKSVHVVKKEAVWKHGIKTFASWNLDRSGGFNPDLGLIGTHFDGTNCTLIHTFYVLSSIVYFSLFKKRGFFFFSFYFSLFPVACLSCWEGKGVCFWMHGVGEPVCG